MVAISLHRGDRKPIQDIANILANIRENIVGSMREESIKETGPVIFMSMKEAEEDRRSGTPVIVSESKEKENSFVITTKLTNIVGTAKEIIEITGIKEHQ